jgi:hydroxymethylbilane synthase
VAAERALLERLDAGCEAPVGGYAEPDAAEGRIRLRGRVLSVDGSRSCEGELTALVASVGEASALGAALAERLAALGAGELVAAARSRSA